MQKLPYKDFKYTNTSLVPRSGFLDTILNTLDDTDHGYYISCAINHINSCKYRTEQLALIPNKRKMNDNELGYIESGMGKARSDKLILDQNNKTEHMVHYRMSKFYVKMGVKVTNNHRVIILNNITYVETIFKTILIKNSSKKRKWKRM